MMRGMARGGILVSLVVLVSGCGYNRIQELDEQAEARQADIETELIRRNDLIPNLVATVDEAAAFERETFTEVARARSGLAGARERMADAIQSGAGGEELSQANAAVTENLRLFLNVSVEAYPQLRASENFRALQDELTETENRLAVRRQDYNETVRTYNTYIRQFPAAITARVIGADRRRPFEAPPAAAQPPAVEFRGSR